MSNIIYKHFYIYKITNLINNKIYIGQRQSKVEPILDTKYTGSGTILKKAFNKYGKENFTKEIIEVCESKEQLNEREIYWIKELNSLVPNDYNIHHGGEGGDTISNHPNKKQIYINSRINRSLSQKGRSLTIEHKQKLSLNHRFQNGIYNPNYDNHYSIETRKRISENHKGKLNSQYGTMWITDGIKNKKILKDLIIPNGWYKGRILANSNNKPLCQLS